MNKYLNIAPTASSGTASGTIIPTRHEGSSLKQIKPMIMNSSIIMRTTRHTNMKYLKIELAICFIFTELSFSGKSNYKMRSLPDQSKYKSCDKSTL